MLVAAFGIEYRVTRIQLPGPAISVSMRNGYQSAGLWGVWLGALARWPGYVESAPSIASSAEVPPRPGGGRRGRRRRGADVADLKHRQATGRRDPGRGSVRAQLAAPGQRQPARLQHREDAGTDPQGVTEAQDGHADSRH